VSPFNSLRRETRAFGVRVLAGVGVFCALGAALIAFTADGVLADAEATETGAPTQAADPAVAPEPVLGAEENTAMAATPTEPAPAPEPTVPEPAPAPELAAAPAAPPEPPAAPADERQSETAPTDEPAADESPPAEAPRGAGVKDQRGEPPSEDSGDEDSVRGEAPRANPEQGEPDVDRSHRGAEPVDESNPEQQEAQVGDEPDLDDEAQDIESRWSGGERRSLRRPNLTGALGLLGGGGKGLGTVPSLQSRVGGSEDEATPPAPPSFAELPISVVQEPPEPPSSNTGPGSTPAPAPTPPNADLGGERGSAGPAESAPAPVGSGSSDGGSGTAGTTTGAAQGFVPAPAASVNAFSDQVGRSRGNGNGSANPEDLRGPPEKGPEGETPTVIRPVEEVVNKVPDSLKYALAALGVLAVMLGVGYFLAAMRARSLGRQRRELLQEVGLLQSALLPPVPEQVGSLRTSVAYRPADGPGAGGDFYDVLPLAGGMVGFILGDVSGHGRGALARTAFMRYTLRAYLEAGLEPRAALKVAGRVIDENLGGDFATVLLAVHDPETGSLTYATAGHPAPIVVGPETHHPVTAGSSPPIGVGVPTGLRQTTVPLVPGAVAVLFTDGLMDARVAGGVLGRARLEELLREMGDDVSARGLIERVSQESRVLSDDIAAVVVSPADGAVAASQFRTEQLELTPRELEGPIAHRFLESCGVARADAEAAVEEARAVAATSGGAILNVVFGDNLSVDVLPRDTDSIEAASRRAATR
jgi:Stage II sporulation protein E (SpoIIE)